MKAVHRAQPHSEALAVVQKKSPLDIYRLLRVELPAAAPMQIYEWIERYCQLWSHNQWKRERYAPSFHVDDENLDPRSWCRFPILSSGYAAELAELKKSLATKANTLDNSHTHW